MFKTFVSLLPGYASYMNMFTSVFQESRTERNMHFFSFIYYAFC